MGVHSFGLRNTNSENGKFVSAFADTMFLDDFFKQPKRQKKKNKNKK